MKKSFASPSRALALAGIIGIAGAGSASYALGALDPAVALSCDPTSASDIKESTSFTPYEDRLTQIPLQPINPEELARSDESVGPAILDALEVAWSVASKGGRSTTYYASRALEPKTTAEDLFAAGGLVLDVEPSDPLAGSYLEAIKAELQERVTSVRLGTLDAGLVWGDPMSNGVRPHVLIWVEGGQNFTLTGERLGHDMVNIGRGIVC